MKRWILCLTALVSLAAAQAQIAWRDMRVEGMWRAVSSDGSNTEAWLSLYPNGRFNLDVDTPNVGSQSMQGSYSITIEQVGAVPSVQVLNLRVESYAVYGDMFTPPKSLRYAMFMDGDSPRITDGNGTEYYRGPERDNVFIAPPVITQPPAVVTPPNVASTMPLTVGAAPAPIMLGSPTVELAAALGASQVPWSVYPSRAALMGAGWSPEPDRQVFLGIASVRRPRGPLWR